MRKDEKPLDYFFRMLVEQKIDFNDLIILYVEYLQINKEENRKDMVEAGFLLSMWNEPKLNRGTHKQLTNRTKKLIDKLGIFPIKSYYG